jgi:hypothetical protein
LTSRKGEAIAGTGRSGQTAGMIVRGVAGSETAPAKIGTGGFTAQPLTRRAVAVALTLRGAARSRRYDTDVKRVFRRPVPERGHRKKTCKGPGKPRSRLRRVNP